MAKRKSGIVQVFLSHSTKDSWISEMLKEKMEEVTGVKVWLDAFDLPGGRSVKQRIREGMRSSTECLILLSPASRQSDWVKHEGGLADAFDLPTAVVLLHVDDADVPDPLRDLKYFGINQFPAYVRHLASLTRKN